MEANEKDLNVIAWRLGQVEVAVKDHTIKLEHVATQDDIKGVRTELSETRVEIASITPTIIKWFVSTALTTALVVAAILGAMHQLGVKP